MTSAQLETYRQIVHMSPGMPPEEAAARAGLSYVPEQAVDSTTAGQIAALEGELSHLESIVPTTGDIPGVGPLDSRSPSWATSDAGLDVRQSASQVMELLGRLHSGGAISDDEHERFATLLGAGLSESDESLRRGIQTIRREIASRLQARPSSSSGVSREHAAVGFTPD